MSRTSAALVAFAAVVIPSTAFAQMQPPETQPPANHGQCVSGINQLFKGVPQLPGQTRSEFVQARNEFRKEACEEFKGKPAETDGNNGGNGD